MGGQKYDNLHRVLRVIWKPFYHEGILRRAKLLAFAVAGFQLFSTSRCLLAV